MSKDYVVVQEKLGKQSEAGAVDGDWLYHPYFRSIGLDGRCILWRNG